MQFRLSKRTVERSSGLQRETSRAFGLVSANPYTLNPKLTQTEASDKVVRAFAIIDLSALLAQAALAGS